jgi:hypothetical protein
MEWSWIELPQKKAIPALLATTHHVEVLGGEIRHVERPLAEQLAPTDPLRLIFVAADPEVRRALGLASETGALKRAALAMACASPEWARVHEQAVRVHSKVVHRLLETAVLRAEARRKLMLDNSKPDRSAMAAASGRTLNRDTQLALEAVLRRRPLARDPALWQTPAAGVVRYLRAAVHREVKRLKEGHAGAEAASQRDVEVYEFVEARPRGGHPAPSWWAALLDEWNEAHSREPPLSVRSFQNSFRRGRKAAFEQPFDDERAQAVLEQRAADRQAAREALDEVVAAAELTPATRATLEALRRGEETPRWARQDLVDRLREAAGTK